MATNIKTMSHGKLVYKSVAVQCVNCSAIVTQNRTANSVTDKAMPLYLDIYYFMLYILVDKPITWSIAQVHINGVNSFDVRTLLILLT